MMFDLSKRQWAWYIAVLFWVVTFILNPVLPRGDLLWLTNVIHNMQMVALWIALFYSSPNKPKEKPSDDKKTEE